MAVEEPDRPVQPDHETSAEKVEIGYRNIVDNINNISMIEGMEYYSSWLIIYQHLETDVQQLAALLFSRISEITAQKAIFYAMYKSKSDIDWMLWENPESKPKPIAYDIEENNNNNI
jgi:hypothetical protein